MKRVPVHLSIEDMNLIQLALAMLSNEQLGDDLIKRKDRLTAILDEEINRNTEVYGPNEDDGPNYEREEVKELAKEIKYPDTHNCSDCQKADVWCEKHTTEIIEYHEARRQI